jgi:hypothetical protein
LDVAGRRLAGGTVLDSWERGHAFGVAGKGNGWRTGDRVAVGSGGETVADRGEAGRREAGPVTGWRPGARPDR